MGDLFAIDYYEYFAKRNPVNLKVTYNLIKLYPNSTRDYKKAATWCSKTYTAENVRSMFWHYIIMPQMIKMQGEYDKAKESFTKFKKIQR